MPERDHAGRPFPSWLVAVVGVVAMAAACIAQAGAGSCGTRGAAGFPAGASRQSTQALGVPRTPRDARRHRRRGTSRMADCWAGSCSDRPANWRTGCRSTGPTSITKWRPLRPCRAASWAGANRPCDVWGSSWRRIPSRGPIARRQSLPTAPTPVIIHETPSPPIAYLRAAVAPILGPLATGVIVIVLAGFMLLKREDLRSRVVRLAVRMLTETTEIIDDVAGRVSRFLLSSQSSTARWVCWWRQQFAIGIPNAALWGLLTAVLGFVPYVGVWTAAMFPLALSFAAFPGWTEPLLVLGCFLLVELLTFHWIEPYLLGAGTGISSLALLVTTIFWTWLWGPAGLLLATPLTVCVVVLARHVPKLAFLDVLLSDESPLSPEVELYQRMLAESSAQAQRVVTSYGQEHGAEAAYDQLILPALRLAELDWHHGARRRTQVGRSCRRS